MQEPDLLLAFALSSLFCIVLLPILIKYAPVLGMVDIPGVRKVHADAVPRSGGIAIVFSAVCTIWLLLELKYDLDRPIFTALMLGAGLVSLSGLLDDKFDLDYRWKFLGQFIALAVVVAQGIQFQTLPFFGLDAVPLWLSLPITALFIIGVTNAVNFSDGLDGLAAGSMLLTFTFLAIFAAYAGETSVALMALAVAGGLFGFLRYNTHPAVVFMGDTGSQFIGFVAASLSILLTQRSAFSPALPLLILGLPILDTLSVMVQRLRAGVSPFSADKRHMHHKLLAYGLPHPKVVATTYLLQSAFLLGAFVLRYAADWMVVAYFVILASMIVGAFYWADKFLWHLSPKQERRRSAFMRQRWIFQFCRKYIEAALLVCLLLATIVAMQVLQLRWGVELALLLLALGCWLGSPLGLQTTVVRIAIYFAGTSLIYINYDLLLNQTSIKIAGYLFLLLLVSITILAVRVTQKSAFRLNNQDLLVLLLFMVAMALVEAKYLTQTILYLCCLGYATEYLLLNQSENVRWLRLIAFVCMFHVVLFAWHAENGGVIDRLQKAQPKPALLLGPHYFPRLK